MQPSAARAFVEQLLARGRYTFTATEAQEAVGSPTATYHALRRLRAAGWLVMPRRGFYVIVDPQHRSLGALPPAWWIADLMAFQKVPYYVGLLSAAALHGAAHQQPQEFQVVAGATLRPITVGRVRMRFFYRRRVEQAITEPLKTPTGFVPISTPEMTAYDLVRYREGAGSLDHVATVIAELAERMTATRLADVGRSEGELSVVQRLGYLLDRLGHSALAEQGLAGVLANHPLHMVPLEPGGAEDAEERNVRWHVLVNTSIEVEA